MKANKFKTKLKERNRFTIPTANMKSLCREYKITKANLEYATFVFEIKYIRLNDGIEIHLISE